MKSEPPYQIMIICVEIQDYDTSLPNCFFVLFCITIFSLSNSFLPPFDLRDSNFYLLLQLHVYFRLINLILIHL